MNLIISCRQFYVNIVKKVKVEKCMSYNIETIKDSRKAKSKKITMFKRRDLKFRGSRSDYF